MPSDVFELLIEEVLFRIYTCIMAAFMHIRKTKVYNPRYSNYVHDYKRIFRFEENHVNWIVENLLVYKGETRGGALTTKMRLEAFLRYMADPGYQIGVGEDLGLNQSSVCRSVHDISERLVQISGQWIRFPQTREEKENASSTWTAKYSFPQTIGAIDCTQIKITKPAHRLHPDEFVNRKGVHSFNVQATCDSKECFTSVCASWAGSVHDARILRSSEIPQIMQSTGSDFLLLGDSGYPIKPWLMVPFSNPETPAQQCFNQVFTKERVIIERCFGQLKRRFPMLTGVVRVATKKIPTLIVACVVLHNVAKYLQDDLPEEIYPEPIIEENIIEDPRVEADAVLRQLGKTKRQQIAEILHNANN